MRQHFHPLITSTMPPSVWPPASLLLPWIRIDCSKPSFFTQHLVNSRRLEVGVVDKNLPLTGRAKWAEPPGTQALSNTWGTWPGEIGWTWVNISERVVSSVEKAGGDGIWREPSCLGILKGSSGRIDIELQRLLADLHSRY